MEIIYDTCTSLRAYCFVSKNGDRRASYNNQRLVIVSRSRQTWVDRLDFFEWLSINPFILDRYRQTPPSLCKYELTEI